MSGFHKWEQQNHRAREQEWQRLCDMIETAPPDTLRRACRAWAAEVLREVTKFQKLPQIKSFQAMLSDVHDSDTCPECSGAGRLRRSGWEEK